MFANSGYVMTLANGIIGVGILAMPFCFQKCGIILSIVLLILSNFVTRICCHYLNKSSLLTRRKSFELLGFHAFGTSGKLLVELCIIGYLLGTCITYFVVVGDLGPQIITKMFSLENDYRHLRTLLMCAVTLFCIIPLGMLKNVDSLSTVFTASIGFYVCLVAKIILESETHILVNDWQEKVVYWQPAGVLQCLPIFSMALSCQMQLFEVFTSINNQSLEKLNGIVRNATWICTFVYIAVGFFGYVAFCTQTFSGNILINLSPSFSSDVIKISFVLSVAFSFPLVIFPCRASLYSLLYRKGQMDVSSYIPETRFKIITVFIVVFSLVVALMIPSVELVIGLVGSTIGVAICIMFPAACFRKIIRKDTTERSLAQFIVISGFCLMILGTYANLSAIDEKSSGAHMQVPQIDENLIKPTELPKNLIDEKIKNIEIAMEQQFVKDKEKEKKLEMIKTKEDIKNNNKNITPVESLNLKPKLPPLVRLEIVTKKSSTPPPLPVDESHSVNKEKELKIEEIKERKIVIDLVKPLPAIHDEIKTKDELNKPPPNINLTEIKKPILNESLMVDLKKATTPNLVVPQQTIDNDAIKKDEEIAKEELNQQKKQETEELKKTKEELEKTKDLLEKKVEELKEELVKQNQETQNLVAEKLGEVVEKFEQIERKVQQKEQDIQQAPEIPPAENNKPPPPPPSIESKLSSNNEKTLDQAKIQKGSLISMLKENRNISTNNMVIKENPVYEPLSYKTGELMEQVRNVSIGEKRMALPLALLINASQAKMNDNSKNSKENLQKIATAALNQNSNSSKIEEQINVDAIRRDILQLHQKENEESTTVKSLEETKHKAERHRLKRSNVQGENNEMCLPEPNVDTLLASGLSGGLDMKIGRDLKSIKNQD